MNMIADKLANALRAVMEFEQRIIACPIDGGKRAALNARAALSEYDATPAACPCLDYARYCETRRDAAVGPHDYEFWNRQRGAAVKASTL